MRMHLIPMLILLAACSFKGVASIVGATGRVSLSSSVDAGNAVSIEVRACARSPGGERRCVTADPNVAPVAEATLLADGGFPLSYAAQVRVGVGVTDTREWQVIAWLAGPDGGTAKGPGAGEWFGRSLVELDDCSDVCRRPCYCGMPTADVVIDSLAP